MQLPTIEFLLFFLLVFTVSIGIRNRPKIFPVFLLIASLAFYLSWDIRFVVIIGVELILVYACLQLVYSPDQTWRNIGLTAGSLVVVGFWFVFKYFNFFSTSLMGLLNTMGLHATLPYLQILAPLGISYYSFKLYSQLHDSHSGKLQIRPSLLDLANFALFFPHITAGPILKPQEFYSQIKSPCDFRMEEVLLLLLSGVVKKVVIGSFLYDLISGPFNSPGDYGSLELLFAAIGYSAMIYADFSGYNDLAVAISRLLGFETPSNFNMPYQSTSLAEYWRRWHITLGRWLKDYLYIPLGGSRRGTPRKYLNLFIVFSFSGLWHGVGANFIIWGAMHGLGICCEDFVRKKADLATATIQGATMRRLVLAGGVFVGWFWTMAVVILTRIFFYSPSMEKALEFWSGMVGGKNSHTDLITPLAVAVVTAIFALNFFELPLMTRAADFLRQRSLSFVVAFFVVFLYVALEFVPDSVAPFVYFRF